MKRQICEKCKHYVQHYGINAGGGIYKIYCGHCIVHHISKKECSKFEEDFALNNREIINKTCLFNQQINSLLNHIASLTENIENFTDEIKKLFNINE